MEKSIHKSALFIFLLIAEISQSFSCMVLLLFFLIPKYGEDIASVITHWKKNLAHQHHSTKKGNKYFLAAMSLFTSSKHFRNICQEADFPLWRSDSQGIVSILVKCLLWQHDLPERIASTSEKPSLAELLLKMHF